MRGHDTFKSLEAYFRMGLVGNDSHGNQIFQWCIYILKFVLSFRHYKMINYISQLKALDATYMKGIFQSNTNCQWKSYPLPMPKVIIRSIFQNFLILLSSSTYGNKRMDELDNNIKYD